MTWSINSSRSLPKGVPLVHRFPTGAIPPPVCAGTFYGGAAVADPVANGGVLRQSRGVMTILTPPKYKNIYFSILKKDL